MKTDLFSCDCECGCAAKIPADRLKHILEELDFPSNPAVLVGPETLDDAGVYQISENQCLIQTVDYFPPVAREPVMYGRIAAANSLSDVYAMGGKPLTALAIVCFPIDVFGPDVLRAITRGAVEKLREAETALLGGHSIVDPQPKYGLAVTGIVEPGHIMDNAHAKPGDALILTKPLGTGITIMAVKAKLAGHDREEEANRCMSALNKEASLTAREYDVAACTDITGFGFLGHALHMARASDVSMEIALSTVPKLDGALEYAAMGLLSGAVYANRKYVGDAVRFSGDIAVAEQDLLFDPQTSGGLLLACPADKAEAALASLKEILDTPCAIVGRVTERSGETAITVGKG